MLFVISGFPSLFLTEALMTSRCKQNHVQLEFLASLSKSLYYLVLMKIALYKLYK